MSAHGANISFNKKEYALLGLVLVIAIIATLSGLLNFNNEEDNVALSAVQQYAEAPVRIDFADENHHFYVSDGKTMWKETLVQENGAWKAENIQKIGNVTSQQTTDSYN